MADLREKMLMVFAISKSVNMAILTLFLLPDTFAFIFSMVFGCYIYLQYLLVSLALILMDGLVSLVVSLIIKLVFRR